MKTKKEQTAPLAQRLRWKIPIIELLALIALVLALLLPWIRSG